MREKMEDILEKKKTIRKNTQSLLKLLELVNKNHLTSFHQDAMKNLAGCQIIKCDQLLITSVLCLLSGMLTDGPSVIKESEPTQLHSLCIFFNVP